MGEAEGAGARPPLCARGSHGGRVGGPLQNVGFLPDPKSQCTVT